VRYSPITSEAPLSAPHAAAISASVRRGALLGTAAEAAIVMLYAWVRREMKGAWTGPVPPPLMSSPPARTAFIVVAHLANSAQ